MVAHISVVSLVVAATLAGFSQAPGSDADADSNTSFLTLVQSVRGAGEQPHSLAAISYEAGVMPADELELLNRGAQAVVPTDVGPMPTPVPVDPDATPLPGPTNGNQLMGNVGGTTSAPTTRSTRPAPATGTLVWPVPGGAISQYYHAGHLALDIAAPLNSTVVAAQSGTVTWAGWRNNGGGFVVEIDHGNGLRTRYNHNNGVWVSPGQYVSAGQAIAPVGMTGIATGPHVHFEVIVNGVIDNPLRYLP